MMVLSDDDAMVPRHARALRPCERGVRRRFPVLHDGGVPRSRVPARRTRTRSTFPPTRARRQRTSTADVYLNRLMAFSPKYNTHPSGYVFETQLAEAHRRAQRRKVLPDAGRRVLRVAGRRGARPQHREHRRAARRGRAAPSKSWGTNMVLMNPGEGKIDQFLSDAHTERQVHAADELHLQQPRDRGSAHGGGGVSRGTLPVPGRPRRLRAGDASRARATCGTERRRLRRSRSSTRTSPRIPSSRDPARRRAGRLPRAGRPDRRQRLHRTASFRKPSTPGDVHHFADALGAADSSPPGGD